MTDIKQIAEGPDKALIEAVCQAMPDPVTPYWKDRQRIAEAVIPVVLESAARAAEGCTSAALSNDGHGKVAAEAIRNLGASQ